MVDRAAYFRKQALEARFGRDTALTQQPEEAQQTLQQGMTIEQGREALSRTARRTINLPPASHYLKTDPKSRD